MASRRKQPNPFAYFANDIDEAEFDSSEEECDENLQSKEKPTDPLTYITKSDTEKSEKEEKVLPKADEVLTKAADPIFLKNREAGSVNWDKLIKNDIDEEDEHEKKSNAMPPPKSYEPVTEKLAPTLGDTGDSKTNTKRSLDSKCMSGNFK